MVAELDIDQPSGARGAEWCTQAGFSYRFDWGPNGLRTLAPLADVVVIVDVRSGSFRKAESEIKTLGRTLRINQQTWLLQTDKPANTIKNALAPHLGADDPLVVIDAGRNRLAWHNLGVFEASSARDLWKLPHERP